MQYQCKVCHGMLASSLARYAPDGGYDGVTSRPMVLWCGMVGREGYGMVWCGMVWGDMVWYGMVLEMQRSVIWLGSAMVCYGA